MAITTTRPTSTPTNDDPAHPLPTPDAPHHPDSPHHPDAPHHLDARHRPDAPHRPDTPPHPDAPHRPDASPRPDAPHHPDASPHPGGLKDVGPTSGALEPGGLEHEGLAGGGLRDLETVGDVVMAGRRSPYPHLSEHLDQTRPTIGALATTIRRLAADPNAWHPSKATHAHAPHPPADTHTPDPNASRPPADAHSHDPHASRPLMDALSPGLDALRSSVGARSPEPGVRVVLLRTGDHEAGVVHLGPDSFIGLGQLEGVICLVEGSMHVATTHAGGMLAMHRLHPGRVRVIGSGFGHELLNTGSSPAVALYAHTRHP